MIAHHGMAYNWSPAEDSPKRPWARFIMHLGNHLSKVVGPTLTPVLTRVVSDRAGCKTSHPP